MANSPIEESDTDLDDDLNQEMEAFKKACQIKNPNTDDDDDALLDSVSDDDEENDDLELMRSIQKRFGVSCDVSMLPDWSEDDCEDDFETLRAIQRRFSAYNDDSKGVDETSKNGMKVGDDTVVDKEEETSGGEKSQVFDGTHGSSPGVEAESGRGDYQFPASAGSFFGAILKNRACQIHIRRKMGEMETRMQELDRVIKEVRLLKGFRASCRSRSGRALNADARTQLISVIKQRGNVKTDENNLPAMYKGPPENPHIAMYNEALARYPVSETRAKWSKDENKNILKGLKQQYQEFLYQNSLKDLSVGADGSTEVRDIDSILSSIKRRDITPENIRLFVPKVNWEQLVEAYVPTRNGAECEARYLNYEDPLINHNDWTKLEEKKLLHVVGRKGPGNWIDIAEALGTSRTPFQCLARYQRSLNREMLNGEWTKEEDDQLTTAVETYGDGDWQVVASAMEGQRRTGVQCSIRWKRTLFPNIKKKGKWTVEEDKCLKVAVALFGPRKWKKVADFVPGRVEYQCRERWFNCLDPSFNKSKWTKREDAKLEAAVAEHGHHHWNKVAACIPSRTDNQCWRRWKALFPHEALASKEARKIQKAALVSNFVDRESHRPTLGHNDFIVPRITGPENVDPSTTKKRRQHHKISKLRPRRKGTKPHNELQENAYEPEMCVWDETISTIKKAAKEKNRAAAAKCGVPPLSDSTLLKDIQKELATVNGNKTNKKRKVLKPCSKRGSVRDGSSVETAVSIDFGDSGISSENVTLQGNASQHSVMGSNDIRDHIFESNGRNKGSSEIEDDNITLASLFRQQRPGKAGRKSKAQSRFSVTDVLITYSRRKRKIESGSNNGNDACKRQVIEVDENLGDLYRTLKKRRLNNK